MVKPSIIVHIPFKMGYRASGGGIRPQKMIEGFKQNGLEVILVEGSHRERAIRFKQVWMMYETGEIDPVGIYSESSSNPTIITDYNNWYQFRDFLYLLKFHKAGKKIALFYRDIHWNFSVADKKHSFLKWAFLKTLHYIDLVFYLFFVDIMLFPSNRMGPFVPFHKLFNKTEELPPGHNQEMSLPLKSENEFPRGIYVGGVLPPVYNISKLFRISNDFKLTICCRADEWEQVSSVYGTPAPNITLVHLSGSELDKELHSSHVAVMVREEHNYLSFSQPLKFYESIGHELPIIVSPGSLVADLVKEWDIGWVTQKPDEKIEFNDYQAKVLNIQKIKAQHTWKARASKVLEFLNS